MSISSNVADLEPVLRERFGLERFRPGQREVIEAVLDRRDVLCVMPTGGGKSLCYQLPALLTPGPTLVVSPLIALMKDQVDALVTLGVHASFINSSLSPEEQHQRLFEAEAGAYDLLYVAPERFRSRRFVEAMERVRPALLAVDEAHCISEWGHDFRPDYARLGQARRALGMPPCIALTATATDAVRRDIADQLDLRDPALFVTGFDRPNLSYEVVEARRDPEKLGALEAALDRMPGPAIVYASSRRRCEEVGRFLEESLRRPTVVYHAGLTAIERTAAQDRFMTGDAEIVVATNAFGMGVDKADIRSVVHFNMPGTIEAYYQEAGRAGRDGQPAQCLLLYAPGDQKIQQIFIDNEYPPPEAVYRIYEHLRSLDDDPIERTREELRADIGLDLNESGVGAAVRILEGAGAVEQFRPRENMAIVRINAEPDEPSLAERLGSQAHVQRIVMLGLEGLVGRRLGEPVYFQPEEFATALGLDRAALGRALRHLTAELSVDYIPPFRGNAIRVVDRNRRARDLGIDFTTLERRKHQEYDKLERMIAYARSHDCRRSVILGYFGDPRGSETHCGHCDNCAGGVASETRPVDSPEGREILLKVLSGVARAGQRGQFGKTIIAQMLVGSGAEKLERWGLNRLTTFGILSGSRLTCKEVVSLLDALTSAGLIDAPEVDRFRPVLQLNERGWQWLRERGTAPLNLSLPDPLARKVLGHSPAAPVPAGSPAGPAPIVHPAPDAEALRQTLRDLRTLWAREANLSPGYVLTNETIDALVLDRPRTLDELASVKGIGPAKLERYGVALLDAIASSGATAAHLVSPPPDAPAPAEVGTTPSPSQPNVPAPLPRPSADYVPTEEWTWRLLDRGFTLDEAAAIRGLDRRAILRHALQSAQTGKPIPLSSFLDPAEADLWLTWHRDHGPAGPPPDSRTPADAWPLFLASLAGPGGE